MGQKYSASKNNQDDELHSTTQHETDDRSPAVSPNYRDIILDCFGKASSDTAARILMRIGQQRSDFKIYKDNLTREQFEFLTHLLSEYLCKVIENIDDVEKVKELSMNYGSQHVNLRLNGFKPDFFASMADAIATECSFLSDSATAHAPTNTFKAWTLLVGLMFSSVRDGFYKELRRQRQQSPSHLKSSRESSTSLENILAGRSEGRLRDSANPEYSRSGSEQSDYNKTITVPDKSPCKQSAHSTARSDDVNANQKTDLLLIDNNQNAVCKSRNNGQSADSPKRPHRYRKSKTTISFSDLLSLPISRSADDNCHLHPHMEQLKRAIKAHSPISGNSGDGHFGRFLKSTASLADYETKRHYRPKSPAPPVTPTFDPNKIIDDFMNDRYKV